MYQESKERLGLVTADKNGRSLETKGLKGVTRARLVSSVYGVGPESDGHDEAIKDICFESSKPDSILPEDSVITMVGAH
jgi:hypothetical protein